MYYPQKEHITLFDNINFAGPMIIYNGIPIEVARERIMDDGYIPMEAITNKENELFKSLSQNLPPHVVSIDAVIMCIGYKENYLS